MLLIIITTISNYLKSSNALNIYYMLMAFYHTFINIAKQHHLLMNSMLFDHIIPTVFC